MIGYEYIDNTWRNEIAHMRDSQSVKLVLDRNDSAQNGGESSWVEDAFCWL